MIGDRVWRDENGHGTQDAGESGWSGIDVDLLSCNGTFVATTTSGSDGSYEFGNLGAGRYKIAEKAPSNAEFSPQTGASSDNSDVDPATGQSWCAEIASASEKCRSLDVGIVPSASGNGRIR
jgi:hypothetical protein